jgi:hypothetical protein
MEYRYLETTGALREAGFEPNRRHRHQSAAKAAMSRAGQGPSWRGKQIPHVVYGLVPESLARENLVFPIGVEGETLKLAAVSHDDVALADKISFVLARPVRLIPASRREVESLIRQYFGADAGSETVDSMLQEFTDEAFSAPELNHPGPAPASIRASEARRPRDRAQVTAARRDDSARDDQSSP